jgi:hypothetical protein
MRFKNQSIRLSVELIELKLKLFDRNIPISKHKNDRRGKSDFVFHFRTKASEFCSTSEKSDFSDFVSFRSVGFMFYLFYQKN